MAEEASTSDGPLRSSVLHVCTSCREPGTPREPWENRAGFKLYLELRDKVQASSLAPHVDVKPAECLSLCPRPCGISLSSPGAWTYLFGDQEPGQTADDIVDLLDSYVRSRDGYLPRDARPKTLRASILGRVPPSEGER